MVVEVVATADLRASTTNVLVVPKGTVGQVVDLTVPPNDTTWRVEFDVNGTTETRWVTDNDIRFKDGLLGPIKAAIELGTQTISTVRYPKLISDTDVIVGDELAFQQSLVEFVFTDGLIVEMEANINTGNIHFRLKA